MKKTCYLTSGFISFMLCAGAYWLLVFFCLSGSVQANSPVSPVFLAEHSAGFQPAEVEVFEDVSAKLTLRDAILPAIAAQFQPYQGIPDFGYTRSAIWVRFQVLSQSDSRWFLHIFGIMRDARFKVYAIPASHSDQDALPPPLERLRFYPSDTYAADFVGGEAYTLYIRTHNLSARPLVRMTLYPEGDFPSNGQLQQMLIMLIAGACLALALYNLMLFFTFYEYSYLTLFALIVLWALDGAGDMLVSWIAQDHYITYRYVLPMMASLFLLQMVRQVVRPSLTTLSGFDKTIDNVLLSFMVFGLLLSIALPLLEFKSRYFIVYAGVMVIIILSVVARSVLLKRIMARWFLLALLFLLGMVVVKTILVATGIISLGSSIATAMIEGTGMFLFLLTLSLMQISRTRQLREDRERAEAANQAKSHFLATMTHELRTPMNAIVGIGSLMKSTPLDAEQKDYLDKLSAASQHLLALVNDLLDFSEVEQTAIKLDVEVFNLHQVVTDIEKILGEQARKKGLTLNCQCNLPENIYIRGDSTRLMQIIMNLCGNAIKFTDKGKVELLIERLDTGEANKTELHFSVSDTGIGMSAAAPQELFQPFTQVDKGTKRSYGGSGLGLFISKQLVSAMGGELEVTSEPEEGSRFFFTLVFGTAAAIPNHEHAPKNEGKTEVLKGKRVLIVDDDEINCFVAQRFLGKRDMLVSTANDGGQALNVLQKQGKNAFDLIFMDISMPGMDGYVTTRRIREMGFSDVPIVALTAHGIVGEHERCMAAGMNDFCTKPFALSEFERLLFRWVNV